MGSAKCIVTFEEDLGGSKECVDNCECLENTYAQDMNNLCTALGDCGAYVNYIGKYTDNGIEWTVDGKKKNVKRDTIIGTAILNDVRARAGV